MCGGIDCCSRIMNRVSHIFLLSELKFDWVKNHGVWYQIIYHQKDFFRQKWLRGMPRPLIFFSKLLNLTKNGLFSQNEKMAISQSISPK